MLLRNGRSGCTEILRRPGIFRRESQDTGSAFGNRHIELILGQTHHRAAGDQAIRLFGEAAAVINGFLESRTDTETEVLRFFDAVTGNGRKAFDEGDALADSIGDGNDRTDVADNAADVHRKSARFDLTACAGFDHHLFSTLRVLRLTSENRNFRNIFESFGQVLDGFRLVVFNADEGLLDAEDFHADLDARDEFVRRFLFDHGTIVTSQIRFTFGTVDDERIDRFVRSQFDVSRESSTAAADDAGFLMSSRISLLSSCFQS